MCTHLLFVCFELSADPPGEEMYCELPSSAADPNSMRKWLCFRGTSQLEGYHGTLNGILAGSNYSAELAARVITAFNFRYEDMQK